MVLAHFPPFKAGRCRMLHPTRKPTCNFEKMWQGPVVSSQGILSACMLAVSTVGSVRVGCAEIPNCNRASACWQSVADLRALSKRYRSFPRGRRRRWITSCTPSGRGMMRWQTVVVHLRPRDEAQPCRCTLATLEKRRYRRGVVVDRGPDEMAALASNASWQCPI